MKFIVPKAQHSTILDIINSHAAYDSFAKANGKYRITNLYFETDDNRIYYETVNRDRFRQKLRLRSYGDIELDDEVFFELKQKHRGIVSKRRTRIRLSDFYRLKDNNYSIDSTYNVSNMQALKEIVYFREFYNVKPKMVLTYERQAFVGVNDSDLRITFDTNLKCREKDLRLESKQKGEYFLDPDKAIMEVKVRNGVPLWLARALSELNCFKQRVSKYRLAFEKPYLYEQQLLGRGDVV
ncbi:polyphosphate polymerase domain-containing protein [Candidatus Syntrophocurvum alkaliphilum]|nr:polyphosphate polymerase domain-containing protein [Candidatus Syntrophocurvum alkaliphilum]